jgi:hypothetical protein
VRRVTEEPVCYVLTIARLPLSKTFASRPKPPGNSLRVWCAVRVQLQSSTAVPLGNLRGLLAERSYSFRFPWFHLILELCLTQLLETTKDRTHLKQATYLFQCPRTFRLYRCRNTSHLPRQPQADSLSIRVLLEQHLESLATLESASVNHNRLPLFHRQHNNVRGCGRIYKHEHKIHMRPKDCALQVAVNCVGFHL